MLRGAVGGLRLEGLPEIGAHLSSYHIADALVRPAPARIVPAWYVRGTCVVIVRAWCLRGACVARARRRGSRGYGVLQSTLAQEAYVSTLAQEAYAIDHFGEATYA